MSMGGHAAMHAQKGGSCDAFGMGRASAHEMQAQGGGHTSHDRTPTHSSSNRTLALATAWTHTCKGGASASVMHED